jgi:hypothetical protein
LKKERKQRSYKNYDFCPYCGFPGCEPVPINPKSFAQVKIHKRLAEHKCMGCGKERDKCTCKSKY